MSTERKRPVGDAGRKERPDRLEESVASQARIAPARRRGASEGDPRAGGDATKAPLTLSQTELAPIEGDSSGVSWDDPDEL